MAYKRPNVMMKKCIIMFASLLCSLWCHSQDRSFPQNANKEYEFSEVVELGLSKETLYANALSWAMGLYEDYKSVVQIESEIDGRLVLKDYNWVIYKMKSSPKMIEERVCYTLTVDCKDNKYRYVLSDIKIEDYTPNQYNNVLGADIHWEVKHEQHLELINKLGVERNDVEKQMENANATLKGGKLKRTTKKLQEQLDDINDKLEIEEFLYNEEYAVFDRLITSLKNKMSVNSDF